MKKDTKAEREQQNVQVTTNRHATKRKGTHGMNNWEEFSLPTILANDDDADPRAARAATP